MNNGKLFISLGGCGNNLLDTIQKETNLIVDPTRQAAYINFAQSDVSDIGRGQKLIIETGGTGRDPNVGKSFAEQNISKIENFCRSILTLKPRPGVKPVDIDSIVILSSLGGGTGSSLTPHVINFFSQKYPVSLIAIFPSNKEGVATLPNAIKSFQNVYNNFVSNDKLKSFLLIDNEFYEKNGNYGTFDFKSINSEIVITLTEFFDEEKVLKNSEGYPSLDVNEKRRVLYWGKGLTDYGKIQFDPKTNIEELKYFSYVFAGKHKLNTAKSVAAQILFKKNKNTAESTGYTAKASEIINKLKKDFKNSAFYFGYTFSNDELSNDAEIRLMANGLAVPNAFNSDTKQAAKAVTRLKIKNEDFNTNEADLDF